MSAAKPPANAPPRQPKPVRRLKHYAGLPIRPIKLRLVDAVTLAAIGLLVLKLTALLADGMPSGPPPPGTPLPDFARVLSSARTGYEPQDPTTTGSVTPKENAAEPPKPAEAPVYQPVMKEPASPTERVILEKLATRRDALKQRSDELDLREKMLGEVERKLETGVGDLRQAEDKADLNGSKKAEAERAGLKSIVTMYETMKPKDAGRVFDRLNLDVLVPLVLAMNPRKMAEILAVMGSEPAEKLTIALANRARGVDAGAVQQASAGGLPANELPALDPGPPTRPSVP
ncbi:MotE family protein [Methylobacterium haplocladii]|uniref:Flagellar protein FlbB n=1 Tax=Methylobacterium haplocladii TaxID=1176176 RepID=A0A512IPY6_9HYPH|nr:hypothetical protein [Methylobacterium haplocladii]GEO99740.1 hypothetical protein MHA02_21280 [Methylobacterium haplocladii]GJD84627.1 hypothetical protein HPGCJGGD_2507 [Methylobacterium haplocladii]GLS61097.1 hypothetical protein GCM10007887_37910 [Methylobacterium haplocladii]